MGLFGFDFTFLLISAIVSLVAAIGIVFMIDYVQPGLMSSKAGTSVFIYIGVFSANLIIEAFRRRLERGRTRR